MVPASNTSVCIGLEILERITSEIKIVVSQGPGDGMVCPGRLKMGYGAHLGSQGVNELLVCTLFFICTLSSYVKVAKYSYAGADGKTGLDTLPTQSTDIIIVCINCAIQSLILV